MTGKNIEDLKRMLIMQMTGEDYIRITRYTYEPLLQALSGLTGHVVRKVEGVDALAKELGCSPSYIYDLVKRTRLNQSDHTDYGVLTEAIVSRIGRPISFDVEKARYLAMEYKKRTK